ncbi:uncharacterized protein TNCV_4347911 [Trichonephila clavipes]|nr:uncharacterized protein TNCV_4347911 [Trichonephila clavipes]
MNPGLFWGQMITVYGCGGTLVSGTIPPTLFYVTLTARTAGVMVWGSIAYDSRSTLIVTLTGQRYVDNIVRPYSSMAGRYPDLSPAEHVWDQLKRQMPLCHSVHDLELAVQDNPSASEHHKVSNQLNAGPYSGMHCS